MKLIIDTTKWTLAQHPGFHVIRDADGDPGAIFALVPVDGVPLAEGVTNAELICNHLNLRFRQTDIIEMGMRAYNIVRTHLNQENPTPEEVGAVDWMLVNGVGEGVYQDIARWLEPYKIILPQYKKPTRTYGGRPNIKSHPIFRRGPDGKKIR